jgi:hypothetical protein
MKELSWEYNKILKSRSEVSDLPQLHSQIKYWLINEREEKDNLNSFTDVSNSLEKGIILINETVKTEEILRLCSFNLTEEFIAESLNSISEKKGFIEINRDEQINIFFNTLVQIRNQIELNMSAYVFKNHTDLRDLLRDEFFTNTLNHDAKAIKYLLLEIRYNIVNHGYLLTESIDRAISGSEDLLKLNLIILRESFQNEDKRYQEGCYNKHLGIEKNLRQLISYLKKDLKA